MNKDTEENLREFSDRVQSLALSGYPAASEDTLKSTMLDAFLDGCSDKHAAYMAWCQEPKDITEALRYMELSRTNQKCLKLRSVDLLETHKSNPVLRAVSSDTPQFSGKNHTVNSNQESSNYSNLEKRVMGLEKKMADLTIIMEKVVESNAAIMQTLNERSRNGGEKKSVFVGHPEEVDLPRLFLATVTIVMSQDILQGSVQSLRSPNSRQTPRGFASWPFPSPSRRGY